VSSFQGYVTVKIPFGINLEGDDLQKELTEVIQGLNPQPQDDSYVLVWDKAEVQEVSEVQER
jgi:hypothetical protein